jgi:Xaa-Pro aminopeptidase
MSSRRRLRAAALALIVGVAPAASAHPEKNAPEPVHFGIARSEYDARREAAMAAMPDGILVVRGAVEEEAGEATKFRQNNTFFYLTGIEAPGGYLVLNPLAPPGARETIYLPAVNPLFERWTGPQVKPDAETALSYGLDDARTVDKLEADLAAILAAADGAKKLRLYTIIPGGSSARFSRDTATVEMLERLITPERRATWAMANASHYLGELRRKKSPAEVELLRRAIAITGEAQAGVARVLGPGRYEYEAEAEILSAYLRNGAMRQGFPSIVGSGPFSTVLHYANNTRKMEAGDLVVVDIGAEYEYYTADVTRTWPVSGTFTPRQRQIYELVLSTQRAVEKAYRPGMTMQDLNRVAREHMKKSPLRDASGATLETAFVHGLGHFLGLEVHDVGDYSKPLQPGDVFTIEPGIYLPDERLGVRIEDDYLVTEKGLVKLSADIPSDPDAIERMVRSRK